jgi:hypothetical protein
MVGGQLAHQGAPQAAVGAEDEDAWSWHAACCLRLPRLQRQKPCP